MTDMSKRHYDGGYVMVIRRKRTLGELDRLGLSLANRDHLWTARERHEFDRRVRELKAQGKGV